MASAFVTWVANRQKELCQQARIPYCDTVVIFGPAPARFQPGWPILMSVLLGYYERDSGTIVIYFYKWDGSDQDLSLLMNVWYHEWLHHYDICYGIPCPPDHNDWYMQRLVIMGLWVGSKGL